MYYIHLPIVNMREGPSGKVVSQALFGEEVRLEKQSGDWILIVTPDGYSGWVPSPSLIARKEPYLATLEITRLSAHIYAAPDTEYGPLFTLPHGSKLVVIDASDPRWIAIELLDGQRAFVQKGDVAPQPFDLVAFSKQFLGLPYTWGGRSSFGYDCSGFVQMLYNRLGISFPRDARQQIADPRLKPVALEKISIGDLLFWGTSEQDIRHVGMSLERPLFIHASSRENKPYLRISSLNDPEWGGGPAAYYPFLAAFSIDI